MRAGIVGGGQGGFIGSAHRIACELDGEAAIVAGAMSRDPAIAQQSAHAWYLDRWYGSFADMARIEAARDDGIDLAIVVTPNDLHYPVAKAFLERGIAVVCDKPLAHSIDDARALCALVASCGEPFALTHTYTGYPAVREARERVRQGELGEIRKVLLEYQQDWLMTPLERTGNKQAIWRTDPSRAGISGCVADIGTHAQNLCEFITGKKIVALCADLTSFVPGRALDDDANILLRLEGGGKGTLTCSQIACGDENALSIRVYGSLAAIEWHQQEPNTLILKPAGRPWERLRSGAAALSAASRAASRLPPGHPEGYLEAFAQLYRDFFADMRRRARGEALRGGYPVAEDGLRGMNFVARAVESSRHGGRWVNV